jgi:site-specific DNA recombinase
LKNHIKTQPAWEINEAHIYRDDGYSGSKLNRPGLERLRDDATMAKFEIVLVTAPDRLARNYVHQVLLIEELAKLGCSVMFLDRPMSDDPHDKLLLQIRGAVAEYERSLITDRMRRGRVAKLKSGQLLPWTTPPYAFLLDAEQPRNPSKVKIDPIKAQIVTQIFTWYTDHRQRMTLYLVAKKLTDMEIPTPSGGKIWNTVTIRNILRNSAYTGTAYGGKYRSVSPQRRASPLQPIGDSKSQQLRTQEEWIPISVPAIIEIEMFEAAQVRLEENKKMARRNNKSHEYLLRGLVSCGHCQGTSKGRVMDKYRYYQCVRYMKPAWSTGGPGTRCPARYTRADDLDQLIWDDLSQIITNPEIITHELKRAQNGEWLPQSLQAQRLRLQDALAKLERQQARLLDAYLAEIIVREEFERKRQELSKTKQGLTQQKRELDQQAQQQINVAQLTQGVTDFCHRMQQLLPNLDFAQRRQLVELLIDRVVTKDSSIEIRYVIPTDPKGERLPFSHLRKDYLSRMLNAIASKTT